MNTVRIQKTFRKFMLINQFIYKLMNCHPQFYYTKGLVVIHAHYIVLCSRAIKS